jgi:nucleotide-binding universal stress UspA family protein
MIAFKNILVPVDFSESSDRAVNVALELAKQYNSALTVVHVFDVPSAYAGMDLSPMDLLAPMLEAARKQLDATLAEVRSKIPSATVVMARGAPWREILNAVDEKHPDLVVMGTHGRRGIERAVLGSVTEKVVRLCPVPVLTVRSEGAGETARRDR